MTPARPPTPASAPPAPAPRRLLLLTDGALTHASSRTRAAGYLPALAAAGYRPVWRPRTGEPARARVDRLRFAFEKRVCGARMRLALRARWDAVFAQRIVLPASALARLARRGTPLVYDFDDALYLQDEAGVGRMVEAASAVVVASPELAGFARAHGKEPVVLPTPVDTDVLRPAARLPVRFTIGWIGSPWTTRYLDAFADVLEDAAHATGARLLLVGADPAIRARLPGADVVPWALDTEAQLLGEMTVGVMPLTGDAWSVGKGAFKLYQYMAAGLPVVASPVGVNRSVVAPGENGFLAETPAEWAAAFNALARSPDLARRLGSTGRRHAVERYSVAACATRLVGVLDTVLPPRLR